MKSVTEFHTHKLVKGIETKNTLATSGKTPEEIQQGIGEAFKLEGDKLKFFFNALDVASQNMEKLARILVVSFNEGESIPHKAVKVEEHFYIPEFQVAAGGPGMGKPPKANTQNKNKKGGPNKGAGRGGEKSAAPKAKDT